MKKIFIPIFFLCCVLFFGTISPVFAETNLINNPSVESSTTDGLPTNWTKGSYGTNSIEFIYPAQGHTGSSALQVKVHSLTDGDGKWFFSDVAVTAGKTYTYSEYYYSDVQTSLVARYKNKTGVFSYVALAQLPSSDTWVNKTVNFVVPSNMVAMTIFHLISSSGSLTTDDYSLSTDTTVQTFSKGMVSLTFDDGWATTYRNAIPLLNTAHFASTQYIISDYLRNAPGYVTLAQAKLMKSQGHEIGSHTQTHANLEELSGEFLLNELAVSLNDLNDSGLGTVKTLAYPYGVYTTSVIEATKSAGYSSARTAQAFDGDAGYNYKNTNKYQLKAYVITKSTTLAKVKSWINTAAKEKTWLIIAFHQIDSSGSQYSYTKNNLSAIINYLKTQQVDVVTVSDGASRMNTN